MSKENVILKIEGMSCGHCKATIERILNADGVLSREVSLDRSEAALMIDTDITSAQVLIDLINKTEVYSATKTQ